MNTITWLEGWYAAQCNGEWEHDHGVSITSLDNPGWRVIIDLTGTGLEARAHDARLAVSGDPPSAANGNMGGPTWLECHLRDRKFIGAGDPTKLGAILDQFKTWATT